MKETRQLTIMEKQEKGDAQKSRKQPPSSNPGSQGEGKPKLQQKVSQEALGTTEW
jgi:hypothetical protein